MKTLIFKFATAGIIALFAFLPACKGKGGGGDAREGGSCKGIGAMEARMVCKNNKILFCSSYTKYVYKVQQVCAAGTVCTISKSGKMGTCKKK